MRNLFLLISILLFSQCNALREKENFVNDKIQADTTKKQDAIQDENVKFSWQEGFGLTHKPDIDSVWGKPVSFYINNEKCDSVAKEFYFGRFRPTDDSTTEQLLKLATTDDTDLRPYYRWCLQKTIQVSDGALAELVGVPARMYAETFPKEFFEYMDADSSGERYKTWVDEISYSGFYDSDSYDKKQEVGIRMLARMKQNCLNCKESFLRRLEKFAGDCFQKRE